MIISAKKAKRSDIFLASKTMKVILCPFLLAVWPEDANFAP